MLRVLALLAFVAVAQEGQQPRYAEPTDQANSGPQKMSPITRVTKMLTEMQQNCMKEGKEDQENADDMNCWCRTNKAEKEASVQANSRKVASAQDVVESMTAKVASTEAVMKAAKSEIASAETAVKEATEAREAQNAEFVQMSTDLENALSKLRNAIDSMKGVHGKSFLQTASIVQHLERSGWSKYTSSLHDDLLHMLAAFPDPTLAAQPKTALAQAPGYQSGAAASGEIFGILQQLEEGMAKDLDVAQRREKDQLNAFNEFTASKRRQMDSANDRYVSRFQEGTQAKIDRANAENEIINGQKALDGDNQFLVDLNAKCQKFNDEFAERTKTRNEEVGAIGEALKILTDENSRALFDRTSAVQFLQVDAQSSLRANVVQLLRSRGVHQKSFALLALAGHASLDAFEKVTAEMDKMIDILNAEQKQEYKDNEQCGQDLRDVSNDLDGIANDLEDSQAAAEEAEETISSLEEEIKQLGKDVKAIQVSIQKAGMLRKKQNVAFTAEVNDQTATVSILNKVMEKLREFYKDPLALAQMKVSQPQASGVMVMIEDIIRDAQKGTKEAVAAEQDAQTEYISFVTESNSAVATAQKSITDKTGQKATAGKSKADADADTRDGQQRRMSATKFETDTHTKCDFLMKNYDVRQEARQNEIDSIAQAKAILKGAK